MSVEELMKYMLAFFQNVEKDLHAKYGELGAKDKELDDLDHYIENNKLKAYEYARVGSLRKTLRTERRQIKYDIEVLEMLKRFTDKYNAKLIQGDIMQNLKEQNKIKQRQQNPKYTYKTNILERLENGK